MKAWVVILKMSRLRGLIFTNINLNHENRYFHLYHIAVVDNWL